MARHLVSIVRRSSRNGERIRRAVVHTTEGHNRPGVSDLKDLADYFRSVDADATFGVDSAGNSIRLKSDSNSPWTQAYYNGGSLSIECVGFASQSKRSWIAGYRGGLNTVANILADWHLRHGIPLRRSVSHGVCSHEQLGLLGGGHVDPGPNFPWLYVLTKARRVVYRRCHWDRTKRRRYRAYGLVLKAINKRYGV